MKHHLTFIVAILVTLCFTSCIAEQKPDGSSATTSPPQLPKPNSGPAYTATAHKPQYGLDLFLHIAKQKPENVCVSPYSLHAALALVRPGARGETLRQIDHTIGSTEKLAAQTRATSLPLETANRAGIEKTLAIKPAYKNSLPAGSYIAADFINQPEHERTSINQWVADRTHGRIQNLIPQHSIDSLTRLALVNAIYTKAKWQHPFNKKETADKPFHQEKGQTISCPTLQNKQHYRHIELPDGQAIAIPFQQRQGKQETCFIAILPKNGTPLRQYLDRLTPAAIQNIRRQLSAAPPVETLLEIPKFKMETGDDLSMPLQKTGLTDAFNPHKANLTGIADSKPPLYISQIIQKCFFEMSEEGVEAAAATVVLVDCYAVASEPPHFKADRPFIWIIADLDPETTPYFIGTLYNPAQ